jgi:predicted membrane protein
MEMKNNGGARGAQSQVVLGVLVIAFGLLFLLDNLDIVDFRHALAFWPMVFIVAGIVKLFDTSAQNGQVIGVALIAVGAVMILNRLGFFYVSWNTLWPVLLIALGGSVVYRAVAGRRAQASHLKSEPDSDVVDVTAIFGGLERRVATPAFRGGEVTALFGGCTLDMRGSSIQGEAVLNVFAVCGGIEIKCPPDWTVILHGTPILGGFDEKTAAPPDVSKRLIVKGYAILGGVDIHN